MFGLETMRHPVQGAGVEVGLGVGVVAPPPMLEAPHAVIVSAKLRSRGTPVWSQRLDGRAIRIVDAPVRHDIWVASFYHAHTR
jgi:hypothetical protein